MESRAVAEDLLQEAFVRGLDRLGGLRDADAAIGWFYQLLRNALIDHLRRRGVERRLFIADEAIDSIEDEPDEELYAEICRCLRVLIETLKPEYAEALRRVELQGATVADFAAEVGITANTAGVRLHRARDALRRRVQQSCASCAVHGCLVCSCAAAPRTA